MEVCCNCQRLLEDPFPTLESTHMRYSLNSKKYHFGSLTAVILCLLLWITASLSASEVPRDYLKKEEDGVKLQLRDLKTDYRLNFKLDGIPTIATSIQGEERAWTFQYSIGNRQGVETEASRLKVGDLLLDPLKTSSGVILKQRGEVITKDDVTYLSAKGFRMLYDAGGTPLAMNTFKVGDVLDTYKRIFTEKNKVSYAESGFQTIGGKVVIPNETTLDERLLSIVKQEPIMPVKVSYKIKLNLDMYLRIDWPDRQNTKPSRYWVTRSGEKKPLYLLPYELKTGDIPLGYIILIDGTEICKKEKPLQEKGPINSLEAIDSNPSCFMVVNLEQKNPLINICPISTTPDDYLPEPGELVLSPKNRNTLLQPILIDDEDALGRLNHEKHDYAFDRYHVPLKGKYNFPFYVYYAYYPAPVTMPCAQGCDALLNIADNLLSGTEKCAKCKRQIHFPPWIQLPIPSLQQLDKAWLRDSITCPYCDVKFQPWQAHDRTDSADENPEIKALNGNIKHPYRLRSYRLMPGATLDEDVFYYKSNEKVIIPKGTPIDDDLRKLLEQRPVSPVAMGEPDANQDAREAVQCPNCFGWIPKPRDVLNISGQLKTDEITRGLASFRYQARRITKMELVVFGLSSHLEPTSGRHEALVITFRRVGDEHFQNITEWEITEQRWAYLPLYAKDDGSFQPRSILQKNENEKATDLDTLFE